MLEGLSKGFGKLSFDQPNPNYQPKVITDHDGNTPNDPNQGGQTQPDSDGGYHRDERYDGGVKPVERQSDDIESVAPMSRPRRGTRSDGFSNQDESF